MKCANYQKEDYKTLRQWARLGYLPYPYVKGTKMWNSRMCTKSYFYFLPNEVYKASDEEIQYLYDCINDVKYTSRKCKDYYFCYHVIDWDIIRYYYIKIDQV